MLLIIFSGLAILPLLIICFGGLFLKNYMSRRTLMLSMFVGCAALVFELYRFYQLTHVQIDLRQWILISDLMSVFPIYASLSVIAFSGLVFLAFEGTQTSKLALASVALFLFVVMGVRWTAFNGQVSELEISKNMLNQTMSLEEMQQVATSGSTKEKIVLATRSDLTIEIIQKLVQDPSEIIRFYGLVNPAIDLKELEILKSSDQSAEIRKQAAIEIKKRTAK